MKKISFLVLLFFLHYNVSAQNNIFKDSTFIPGSTYYGNNSYSVYYAGDLPLILSAPHGGSQAPSEIPDRTYGTTDNDLRTKEMAQYLQQEILKLTGKYPHVIINDLRRIKMDANRDSVEAAQGNQLAIRAWQEYQSFVLSSREKVNSDFGKGLYIDLHGHGHSIQRFELGYLLSASELNKSNQELNSSIYINKSSIKNLVDANVHSLSFTDLLRGPKSLGGYFESAGFPAVPSPNNTSPESDPYFTGGYCTELYGSVNGGAIDGIQIEHNRIGIRDSDANVKSYSKILAGVLLEFIKYHYNLDFITDIENDDLLTNDYYLSQNYPNPFNPNTTIRFAIPVESRLPANAGQVTSFLHYVTLRVYDMLGREVATLVNEEKSPGYYEVEFNGDGMASGIYFYTLIVANYSSDKSGSEFHETKKMLLIK